MKPKSETLFHFTKNLDVLYGILRGGFWPRYCPEDIQWLNTEPEDEPFVWFPMVCFCDIPLTRIEEHVLFYGQYGLGLTREWALKNGLCPIHYIPGQNVFTETFKKLGEHATEEKNAGRLEVLTNLCRLAMYMKPLSGIMPLNGQPMVKEFYQESEWRHIATDENIPFFLSDVHMKDENALNAANDATKQHCMLRFSPSDVKYIFVRTDADIPPLMNFIQSELDNHPSADLKILMSRVTSLESIRKDW